MAFLLTGTYLKNNIDISEAWLTRTGLDHMYTSLLNLQIEQSSNTLFYAMWSLYMFSNIYCKPGMHNRGTISDIVTYVSQLINIYTVENNQLNQQDLQQFLLLASLIYANTIHLHPREDTNLIESVLCDFIAPKFQENHSIEVFKSLLVCFLKTIKNTTIHSTPWVLSKIKEVIVQIF